MIPYLEIYLGFICIFFRRFLFLVKQLCSVITFAGANNKNKLPLFWKKKTSIQGRNHRNIKHFFAIPIYTHIFYRHKL